jgi:uncharacterized protein (TIGR02266 family)
MMTSYDSAVAKGQENRTDVDKMERPASVSDCGEKHHGDRLELLNEEDRLVGEEASRLEADIRQLADEMSRLHERKKGLEEQARVIGKKRSDILARRKNIERERTERDKELEAERDREKKVEQQQAFEDTLKKARIESIDQSRSEEQADNRRSSPRVSAAVDVTMNTEHNFYAGITVNISEGGVFVATYDKLPMGTIMELNVSLPGSSPIQAVGEVVWIREHNRFTEDLPAGVGVKFTEISQEDRLAIEEFSRVRAPMLYES